MVRVELDEDLVPLLNQSNQPLKSTVREYLVLELYRRGAISSGKGAELLNMPRLTFIQYTSRLGIPFLDLSENELEGELRTLENL